ncbi:drug resistance family protein, putative [Babesia ovata]|uniref:Drug resistance family protein, putative n=1 Tax=Babesia ovata TaxID=189622 RepID=A0A2H6KGP5_9APIC|nr:drug resistance family protein, putative [Babesia ovata]GBE62147.1 drug resistance family protein, putative [Babesia ovata]
MVVSELRLNSDTSIIEFPTSTKPLGALGFTFRMVMPERSTKSWVFADDVSPHGAGALTVRVAAAVGLPIQQRVDVDERARQHTKLVDLNGTQVAHFGSVPLLQRVGEALTGHQGGIVGREHRGGEG